MTNPTPVSHISRARARIAGRTSFALLGLVLVVLFAFGSVHHPTSTRAARIAYLDSVIKCPACEDISIAQSDIVQARELRAKVAQLVGRGETNAQVESYVTEHFGSNEILVPSGSAIARAAWVIPLVAIPLAVVILGQFLWRRRTRHPSSLSEEDAALVAEAQAIAARAR